jgi:diguanylate cyclase (GGDEF)-like protein
VKNARLHEETVALAITDSLTGFPNRRHLFARLEMEIARANRFGNQVSILMVDIDHFKNFNDAAGHRAGDSVLRQAADLMKGMIRKVDTVARYGGEEFVLILSQVTKLEAIEVAQKLRCALELTAFEVGNIAGPGRITVSVGVANLPVDAMTQEKLLDCADAALYASKRAGRNQVTAYAPGMETAPKGASAARPAIALAPAE